MQKFIVEFVGTFLFLSIIIKSGKFGNVQPFVIVAGLLSAILLGGDVSGGHFNPAVTVMMYLKDKSFGQTNLQGYVAAQVLGGVMALEASKLIKA
jgi:aquaporin Z